MGTSLLDRLGYLLCNPYTLPAWAFTAAALCHLFIARRRGHALQCLNAAWFALLVSDLAGLETFLLGLLKPSGCGLFLPSGRDVLLAIHVPHAALAVVSLPILGLSGRSLGTVLRQGAGIVLAGFVQANLVIHLSLWFFATPEGQVPSITGYLKLYE